ncbi:carbamoyltransferase N-terminal domain-containing protein, partial [Acidobacteriota bacterium]
MKYFLGINTSHSASACLLKDNTIVSAIEEERLNKDKHSASRKISHISGEWDVRVMPNLSISYVLHEAGIKIDDVDQILINDCDLLAQKKIPDARSFLCS